MKNDKSQDNKLIHIKKLAEKYSDDIISFSSKLIKTPSFSTQEGEVVKIIEEEMKKCNFDRVFSDSMGNIIGIIGNGKTKIMVDAHIDTVGIGDEKQWKINPFSGIIKNGCIWGRGATDQKLSMSAIVYAGKIIKELNLAEKYTYIAVGSVQEEDCDGLPLLHIIEKEKIVPDYVIITEPTNLAVYIGHRGRMEIKITLKGKSAHASAPQRGKNALEMAAEVINDIKELNLKLKKYPFLGKGTIAVTYQECKTPSLNAIPDLAILYLDRRLTLGENKHTALKEIKTLPSVKKYKAAVEILHYKAKSWKGLEVEQEKYFPTWLMSKSHPLVRSAIKAAEFSLGKKPSIGRWIFSTNGVASCGRLGIPTVGFGPSNEIYAHSVDEQMPINHLLKATEFYASIGYFLTEEKI